mmetsp:Transcript_15145/g.46224  ORF Transcript_15145/g.46224 Transcript_15145/m.46224 type:complete len:82 (-) Transcript_15145:1186-1431(-)
MREPSGGSGGWGGRRSNASHRGAVHTPGIRPRAVALQQYARGEARGEDLACLATDAAAVDQEALPSREGGRRSHLTLRSTL